jgi:hypothetical protein
VPLYTFADIETAIRQSWDIDTCDDHDVYQWTPENPSRGQCGVTAMTLQDLIGGDLLESEVFYADGSHQGYHYWNRLAGGLEIDLTRAQLQDGEIVATPVALHRLAPLPNRLADKYVLLRTRVGERLGLDTWPEWVPPTATEAVSDAKVSAE